MFKRKRKAKKYITWERPSPTYTHRRVRKKFLQIRKNKITNPSKPKRKINPLLSKLLTGGVLALVIGFLLFSDLLKINNLKFEDYNFEKQTINLQIENILNEAKGEHIMFFNTEIATENILDKISSIESISVKKRFPNTLLISYQEFPLVANIRNESPQGKKSYIINTTGYAIKQNLEQPDLPYIIIITAEPLNIDIPLINADQITYIIEAKANFEDKFGMKIIETKYLKSARELHLITEKDFTIWLDIQHPHEDQYRKLKKALVKLDIYNTPLEYIDLRIAGENGDKIIYKAK
ncbi:hypothetical protein CVV38_04175 [Candidatus Peregrinibacteria bacterium HGW-Peregrinibacteria-1]|jgi:hypothetical protein|nr:MAG: hypothetical protein CVV38_04175 [Candidatus Peregrinibacteria bacterium HGW-Peregrinibacteria-1]